MTKQAGLSEHDYPVYAAQLFSISWRSRRHSSGLLGYALQIAFEFRRH